MLSRSRTLEKWLLALAGVGSVAAMGWYRYREHKLRLRARERFNERDLDTILVAGATDSSSVRLWGRTCAPGKHVLEVNETSGEHERRVGEWSVLVMPASGSDATFVIDYPSQVSGGKPLQKCTDYVCRLHTAEGTLVGTAKFTTAPTGLVDSPSRVALAAVSCHLPFDERGDVHPRAERLLSIACPLLREMDVRRIVMMGDQVYGDLPEHCSLFDNDYFRSVAPAGRTTLFECSRDEVRQLYQRRHRIFWSGEAIRELQQSFPCYLIADDHEVFDNYGSAPEHRSPEYQAIAGGAFDAYYDYQASRTLGRRGQRVDGFEYSFEYGLLATFVLDLRSERTANEDEIVLYSDRQLEELRQFLSEHHSSHVICVVISVPFLHVPDWFMQIGVNFASSDGDISDRWSHPKARRSRNRLLRLLRDHQASCPRQRLVILGGDVHIGMVGKLDWGEGIAPSYQLVSSAFSNALASPSRQLVKLLNHREPITIDEDGVALEATFLENRLPGSHDTNNPYGGLNMGIVEVQRLTETESSVRLLLLGCSDDGPPEAQVMFDGGPL